MSVCKYCVKQCQMGTSISWYNRNFKKLIFGLAVTPAVVGLVSAVAVKEPFYGAFGCAFGFIGTMVVEVLGEQVSLKESQRRYACKAGKTMDLPQASSSSIEDFD